MNEILEQKIKLLPENPGVYVMLDKDGQVIYVGKAKVLKNRVKQYFYSGVKTDKVMAMVSCIHDFYYIITKSEVDALSLENNLIKKYKPKYNILLKDDKNYPYFRLDTKRLYPYFEITRKIKRDGAKYFGPFMAGVSARELLDIVNECYNLRSCKLDLDGFKMQKRECLNYHINRCKAPCTGRISPKEYKEDLERAIDFLSGNDEDAEIILKNKMQSLAERGEFELAIAIRDKLKMLDALKQRKITNLNRFINGDVIAICANGLYYAVSILFLRSGKILGAKSFSISSIANDISDVYTEFITRYYTKDTELPDEIILYEDCRDPLVLTDFYRTERKKTINILVPKQGIRRQLADMAYQNASDYLEKTVSAIMHKDDLTVNACQRLKEVLNLSKYPKRMECYDISNISGVDKVASMVVFTDGEKDSAQYRRFMIKTVEGANDFASLQEVLLRRLSKLGTDEEENFPRPDLIVIDGGKGQLSAVKEIFDSLKIEGIDLISLAKREEEIFTIHSNIPVVLPHRDYAVRLLQRIRDEAHRFAITYFRSKHLKHNLESLLDDIPYLGPKRKKDLLAAFRTVEAIKQASVEELTAVEGIGQKRAQTIYNYLRSESQNDND